MYSHMTSTQPCMHKRPTRNGQGSRNSKPKRRQPHSQHEPHNASLPRARAIDSPAIHRRSNPYKCLLDFRRRRCQEGRWWPQEGYAHHPHPLPSAAPQDAAAAAIESHARAATLDDPSGVDAVQTEGERDGGVGIATVGFQCGERTSGRARVQQGFRVMDL